MSKELVTKGDAIKDLMLEVLAPIFLKDSKTTEPAEPTDLEIHKIRLMTVRRILIREYRFFESQPRQDGIVEMGRDTLGTVLYDYIAKKYGKRGEIYITKGIEKSTRERLSRLVAVDKEDIKEEKIPALYTQQFFEKDSFKNNCGPFKVSDDSDYNFINERINKLFSYPEKFKIIFEKILGPIAKGKPEISVQDDKFFIDSKPLTISDDDYSEFNIASILGNSRLIIEDIMKNQIDYLGEHLDCWEKFQTRKMIIALKTMWRDFASLPEENLKSISIWIFVLIRIKSDLEEFSETISDDAKKELTKFIIEITPKYEQELKPPELKKSSSSVQSYFKRNPTLTKIFSLTFSKESSKIYFKYFLSNEDRYASQKNLISEKIKSGKLQDSMKQSYEEKLNIIEKDALLSNLVEDMQGAVQEKLQLAVEFQLRNEELEKVKDELRKTPLNEELKNQKNQLQGEIKLCEDKVSLISKILPYLEIRAEIKSKLKKMMDRLDEIAKLLQTHPSNKQALTTEQKLLNTSHAKLLEEEKANNQKIRESSSSSLYGPGSPTFLASKAKSSLFPVGMARDTNLAKTAP